MDYTVNSITEEIGRQTIKILYDNLNNRLDSLAAGWSAEDVSYFTSIGRSDPGFTVEHIEAENFYPGVVPSLMDSEIDKYPNCCAFANIATPRNTSDDFGDFYSILLRIEIMVKSTETELETNSRISRTLQAAHQVMQENKRINGLVTNMGVPRQTKGPVFVKREKPGMGQRFFWQGGALEFTVEKYIDLS